MPRAKCRFGRAKCEIQGVGETLRGTLNNNIDQRWSKHSSNPDKMAYVNTKNQATLEAGRREMVSTIRAET